MSEGVPNSDERWRITMRVELSNSDKILSESEFVEMVSEAVKRVLGQAGPNYELGSFDGNTRKGSLVVSAADSHLVWAALSIYGRHFGAPVALHLNSLTVVERC
ncbi:hypothetical protein Tcan_10737 [Toxocara canis]|uniref:Uncharacterized protein n=1 Tax=Toxocara canis TaxID=6265 RepID=A0A0B2VAN6_TOXCA|nr:hypothetical protein Tcan_10737 [Toxocara canis]